MGKTDTDLNEVEAYINQLKILDWFSNIGKPYDHPGMLIVNSWDDAFKWSNQPITEWCSFEASIRIYKFMSKNHYNVFAKWNDVAKSILPHALDLVAVVKNRLPISAPNHAAEHFQAQLVGAALELYYSKYFDSKLCRDQIEIYRDGHFPCGWYVESESDFPDKASVVVF